MRDDDDEVLEQGYRDFLDYQPRDFRSSLPGIQAAIEEISEVNPKAKGLKPSEVVDLSLIEQLERSGFIVQMKKLYAR